MNEEQIENYKSLHYRMNDEGFHYCFDSYSNWEEIEDEEFHTLRNAYLLHAKSLETYIEKKYDEALEAEEAENNL